MSEETAAESPKTYPDSTFKLPRPFGNIFNASAYPQWEPVDTAGETKKIFKFTFYTTVGAYAWLYFWKRTAFKVELPLTVIGFTTVATATKGIITNLREKNDGWNTFWAVAAGNLAVLTGGFKTMPLKHKFMTGISGAAITGLLNQWSWAQSVNSPGREVKHILNTGEEVPKQQFWDVMRRRPISQTVDEMGVGRGILKP
ncbi:hypothetical protein PSN45_005001 [Yamadazyma tenuis]|uniref:Uncharacterized protein n=1 Tax=Candida tenuis (strain ATCC 10573 / BCRC 21748 / CBS 615 / JCM 9827 / NBRC 10315 / NRRL Y-1498 / VKM Y-70) TaxID=590646 RepID=G3B2F7_CANTC|nr:uncharacterized protein CANTEDRAFT_97530 [Yamadazyma tenuis ATCC 10573]EGV64663.1 hypothetical protein CANTEDRAFT_97530 [Yamadazyma tenuis ATCC 10573]WEJ97450.1 hypothetical protein PSN45_005001 [Yamadazyma tenuis]